MTKLLTPILMIIVGFGFIFSAFVGAVSAQNMDKIERARMKSILKIVKENVKKNYYDPNYRGIDLEVRFKKAEERLDQVTTTSQALSAIAQVLIEFNDSHLFLIPPATTIAVEYGWRMQMYGEKCFITQVKPGSDAEKKGVKPGDQILAVSGFKPSRKELWKMMYFYNVLSKRDKLTLNILSPGAEEPRELVVEAQLKKLPQMITFSTYFRLFEDFYEEENDKHRFWNLGGIGIWRMPSFAFDPNYVEDGIGNIKNSNTMILDLRGNGGGYVKTLEKLAGNTFDRDLKIADLVGRKKMDPISSKTRGGSAYKGKIIVLIDSRSGSAAEMFARLIQLEKRGIVIGDVSSGSVMQSVQHEGEMGTQTIIQFGVSVTNADVIMSDGKSVEHVGVIPDELIIPTGEELLKGQDPVMARAVAIAGGNISPEDAAKMSKYYWKKD